MQTFSIVSAMAIVGFAAAIPMDISPNDILGERNALPFGNENFIAPAPTTKSAIVQGPTSSAIPVMPIASVAPHPTQSVLPITTKVSTQAPVSYKQTVSAPAAPVETAKGSWW